MKISHPERGGNGERLGVVNQCLRFRIRRFAELSVSHCLQSAAPSLKRDAAGRVAEWFKAPVLKTGVPARVPWVRIPPLPPVPCSPLLAAVTGSAEDLGYSGRPRNRRPMLKLKAWERRDKARLVYSTETTAEKGPSPTTPDPFTAFVNRSVGTSNESNRKSDGQNHFKHDRLLQNIHPLIALPHPTPPPRLSQ